jgi:serine/threonine protein kinase
MKSPPKSAWAATCKVHHARDTRLDRDVAIKNIPQFFAHDPGYLARFEGETRTLTVLNHPNIAIIHDFDEANEIRALVMELVDGPTLADRIAQGPIPLDEALAIAKDVAEALAHAPLSNNGTVGAAHSRELGKALGHPELAPTSSN